MSQQYYYNFAYIDPDSNMCIELLSSTSDDTGEPNLVVIDVYDEEYLGKYYNWDNGKFYYDPEYTQEYISPLL